MSRAYVEEAPSTEGGLETDALKSRLGGEQGLETQITLVRWEPL